MVISDSYRLYLLVSQVYNLQEYSMNTYPAVGLPAADQTEI